MPIAAPDTKTRLWDYRFSVWPDETDPWPESVYLLFKLLGQRVEHTTTEAEFADFRWELSQAGFSLREVERVPHSEPEAVQ